MSAPVAADVHIALRDGSTAHVRPVVPADAPALRTFLQNLSENSRWLRFFSLGVNLDKAAERAAAGDRPEGYGLIVTTGSEKRVVAHAVFELERPDRAEVAFAVADEMQGRGLATVLLAHLAQVASARGVTTFTATVLPENRRMISVFRESGFPVEVHASPDGIEIVFPTELGADARRRFEDRDRVAAVAAVERVLRPRSVAVVGASRRPDSFGGATFRHILGNDFRGELHPVNPNAEFVGSRRAVSRVEAGVDLAIVAVPAAAVPGVARECAEAGVAALVVITAGFAEAGAEGAARLAELLDVCRASGMRLVGPNCMGVVNTAPDVSLTATFARADVPAGTIGFVSQSGAFGAAAIDGASRRGIGLSAFVSLGDKADLSSNDFMQYWEQDPSTEVVALYLESFGNPRKFGRVARRLARAKPVLAVKAGRTSAGARAASSHTGALIAASDSTVDALFASAGVIRCDGLDDLLDAAAVLAEQPLPSGSGVAIVANARGPLVVCADACADAGLEAATLSEATQRELAEQLPPESVVAGPVQLVAGASPATFAAVAGRVAADPAVDAVIAIFVEHIATGADDVAAALAALSLPIPLLAVFMTPGNLPVVLRGGATGRRAADAPPLDQGPPSPAARLAAAAQSAVAEAKTRWSAAAHGLTPAARAADSASGPPAGRKIPTFRAPERAAHALGRAAAYARWRATPAAEPPALDDVDADAAAAILAGALARGGGWLRPDEVEALLGAYGLALVEQRRVSTPAAAAKAAAELGGEVALKGIAPGVVHKAQAGAVQLNLSGPTAVKRAANEIAAQLDAAGTPVAEFLVQRMADPGVEMLVGVLTDERFGPVVACGAGGGFAEVLGDVQVRLAPLAREDALDMISRLRSLPLLSRANADIEALADIAVRVGALADAHPAIAELDLNPVMVSAEGAPVVDARVRVAPPAVQPVFPAVGR
ncbi:GNAT family N-acetyltransferase [Solirubrobacter sp. CPCC 204708]|uniref:GNAT family N-acetyltransferase n=1 Tax=Solirubrobacter deserti TaxID=2282478 RepID=A0ABT4RDH1_9ACTN|nr:bifunctional GNAT family N-acetyltransferase/acetate--CoA ligase family protein [Solirubrobacter deserti]MBE2314586.1 GNAT family N-acetyltransferase [Solirubrobacter deserti]MDA0136590.1 GNAT family N-acetyltransferase [Solirubrobacter deserti]